MENLKKENWPNFLVIGAAKCGTTSLYHYLKSHPEVYMSPIKEPNYFSSDINPENFSQQYKDIERRKRLNLDAYVKGDMKREVWGYFVRERHHYTGLFKNVSNEKAIGEISNSYLFSKEAAINIKNTLPSVKLIAILRNPVERMYSHYMANLRDGKTYKPFRQEVEEDYHQPVKGWYTTHCYVEMGLYYEQIKRFLDIFPKEQIRIYLYDDLKNYPETLLKDVSLFLGIDAGFKFNTALKFNEAKVPKNEKLLYWLSASGLKKNIFRLMPDSKKEKLKSLFFKKEKAKPLSDEDKFWAAGFYKNEIAGLQELTGRNLSSWLPHMQTVK
ncbi:MAG: sulfotransferase [Bacteroidia bacterium]|nr:sulfotransferase [Bacteroidia bacterium]